MLVEVLALLFVRDGVRVAPATVTAQVAAACDAGSPAACALRDRGTGDRLALGSALVPACDGGDAVACLGVAWSLLPETAGGVDPARPTEPERYRELVERVCTAGVARGCTELGYVHFHGVATYRSTPRALRIWDRACGAGESHACTAVGVEDDDPEALAAGAEGGDPRAWLEIAARDPARATEAYEAACLAGVTSGCHALAERMVSVDPSRARTRLVAACEVGDPASCALLTRFDAVIGEIPVSVAEERLAGLCALVDSACEEASFLAQGAEPLLVYPGGLGPKDVARGLFDARDPLRECQLGVLSRNPNAGGFVEAVMRVGEDGKVSAVHVDEPLDALYAACVVEALTGIPIRRPEGGVTRVVQGLPVFHGARVELQSLATDGGGEVGRLAKDLTAWAGPLDACFLDHDRPEVGVKMSVALMAGRDGRATNVEIVRSSENPAVDTCVVDWIGSHQAVSRVGIPTRMRADIEFLVPLEAPLDTAEAPIRVAPPPPADPVVVRMLVVTVSRSKIDRRRGRLGGPSVTSIEDAHRAMAEYVFDHTHGVVRIEPTFRTVDARLEQASMIDDEAGAARWNLSPDDLPLDVVDAIAPGRWDSVFVWAPIPRGFPQPALGVTYTSVTVRGATLSTGVLPSRTELHANPGAPRLELPLHEWWHQVETRAERLLGLDWLPQNHDVLRVDGRALDPRTWLSESQTVMGWYDEVLGYRIHADLWRDLWQGGDRVGDPDTNVALRGFGIGEGTFDSDGLNDTFVSFGAFENLPHADPEASTVWFGIGWNEPARVGRVIAHLGGEKDPSSPSFAAEIVEVQLATDPSRWVAVAAERTTEGVIDTLRFPPVEVYALRIPAANVPHAMCRELEVYAE